MSAANPSRPSGARQAHRGNDLATIQILAAECGLIKPARDGFPKDDSDYRALVLARSNGVTDSAKALDFTQRAPLIEHLRVLKRSLRVAGGKRERVALSPMQKKVFALSKALESAGALRSSEWRSLRAYIERQTGVQALEWCDSKHRTNLIESLKGWGLRVGADVSQ